MNNIAESCLAVTDVESCDNLILEHCPEKISGVSSQWIQDSIDDTMSVDPGCYIVWDPYKTSEDAGGTISPGQQRTDPDNNAEIDDDDEEQNDPPVMVLSPPKFRELPMVADRAIDEKWMLGTARSFFSDKPKASWGAFHRWCARNVSSLHFVTFW